MRGASSPPPKKGCNSLTPTVVRYLEDRNAFSPLQGLNKGSQKPMIILWCLFLPMKDPVSPSTLGKFSSFPAFAFLILLLLTNAMSFYFSWELWPSDMCLLSTSVYVCRFEPLIMETQTGKALDTVSAMGTQSTWDSLHHNNPHTSL